MYIYFDVTKSHLVTSSITSSWGDGRNLKQTEGWLNVLITVTLKSWLTSPTKVHTVKVVGKSSIHYGYTQNICSLYLRVCNNLSQMPSLKVFLTGEVFLVLLWHNFLSYWEQQNMVKGLGWVIIVIDNNSTQG